MKPRPTAQPDDACRHRLLARGTAHQITLCTCGSVHLTFGNTTLRLSRDQFGGMAESIARAAGELVEPLPAPTASTVH